WWWRGLRHGDRGIRCHTGTGGGRDPGALAVCLRLYRITPGYCWSTPNCRKLCLAYAVFEGPRTWKIRSAKSGHVAWKEVDQQYPPVTWTNRSRRQRHGSSSPSHSSPCPMSDKVEKNR